MTQKNETPGPAIRPEQLQRILELAEGIRIERDPLTPHPSIGIKLEDYVWVELGHLGNQ